MIERLYGIFASREGQKKEDLSAGTHYVVFVCGEHELFKHPVSRYIEDCSKYGVTFVFFEDMLNHLPKGCGRVCIMNQDQTSAKVINAVNSEDEIEFTYPDISEEKTEDIALRLGSVNMDEISLEGTLTKQISLYELLHIVSAEDIDLGRNWRQSEIYKSMAAPLGVKSGNEIICLDLNEKHHGPHGLVAGTTGSGKSEILLSYILSMAVRYHPHEVGFVIIDFKGGGMANQLKNLPHLISTITNIDGNELMRSLLSIKAELRKRQEVFAEYDRFQPF